jgi:hypothetical protein
LKTCLPPQRWHLSPPIPLAFQDTCHKIHWNILRTWWDWERPIQPELIFMYWFGTLTLYACANVVLYVFLHFKPIDHLPQQLPCCFSHHSVSPWAHHALFA